MPTKKITKKPVAKKAPVMTTPCGKEIACTGCTCKPSKFKCVRNILILVVVFALGFMTCRLCPHSGHGAAAVVEKPQHQQRHQFTDDGCLILTPERLARFEARGVDTTCITREQLQEWREARRAQRAERIEAGEHPRRRH